jgi:hypothetical protein
MDSPGRRSADRAWGLIAWLSLLACLGVAHADEPPVPSQPQLAPSEPRLVAYDLSGPRVGVTYRPEGDTREVGRFVSQFGWHVETQVASQAGPQFLVQFVPLVAGVEYGKFLPSASLGLGVRVPSGYEFGVGPTVAAGRSSDQRAGLHSAIFGAIGRTFDYGGVGVPVNLVVAGNKDGSRITFLVGYAVRRASRPLP